MKRYIALWAVTVGVGLSDMGSRHGSVWLIVLGNAMIFIGLDVAIPKRTDAARPEQEKNK